MKVNILGVKIDDINLDQALKVVEKWIWNPGKHYIVTPNPEFLVAAQKDPVFKNILNKADLSIPDGVGLRLSGKIKNTFSGTDFMEMLVKLASEKGFAVSFLGGKNGVAAKAAECLKRKYPGLKVAFAESDIEVDKEGNVIPAQAGIQLANRLNMKSSYLMDSRLRGNDKQKVDVLFVAFGHIKQEKWIARSLDKIPVKVAMGVGGAFDYFSGRVPRAPKWIRGLGLEWLFRLVIQPARVKRQLSLIKYLFMLIWNNDSN